MNTPTVQAGSLSILLQSMAAGMFGGAGSYGDVLSLDCPWQNADFCVVDIETTGLNCRRDRIISFGAVPVSGGRAIVAESTYTLIKPECRISEESIKIHALRQSDLVDAPTLDECLDDLSSALDGRFLVAHSAWIERGFLRRALKPHGIRLLQPILDTATLAQRCLGITPDPGGHQISLEYASSMLGLPAHTPHHALGDAMTTAQLFLALAGRISADRPLSVADLAALSHI